MTRLLFSAAIKRATPPWLQRVVGAKLMDSLVAPVDELVDDLVAGVKARFPGIHTDETPLSFIGRERRIRRGPGEPATTYATRLQTWWDAHRTRGGPYALLGQLRAFFVDWLNVRIDVVYHSGTRRWMDTAGAITRDSITWDGDGTDHWSQFWVIFHVPAFIPTSGALELLVDQDDDEITTQDGEEIIVSSTVAVGSLTDAEKDVFRAIPREWSAAHIERIWIVLLYGDGELWDYPQPMGTWTEWEDPMVTWDADAPVIFLAE
jgi:hypothetical protein